MARQLHRLLFIRTDRLGETLLNLPAVAALQAALPDASVSLLVHPELAPLLAEIPGLAGVLTVPSTAAGPWWVRAWRMGRSLSRHQFDCAIVSNPKKELHAAVWLAGIPVRVGYGRKWGCLLTRRLVDRKALGERHEVEYNLDLVRSLDLPARALPWRFPSFSREQDDVFRLPELQGHSPSEPLLAVHPFSSTPVKRWPAERYRQLIRLATDQLRARVVVVGGPETRDDVSTLLPTEGRAVNLVGRLTLRQLAGLLQRARLLVSNDSGPVHLASAVGTRTVVLFGAAHPAAGSRRWGPWGPGHTVIARASLAEITVEEVFEAIRGILNCPLHAAS